MRRSERSFKKMLYFCSVLNGQCSKESCRSDRSGRTRNPLYGLSVPGVWIPHFPHQTLLKRKPVSLLEMQACFVRCGPGENRTPVHTGERDAFYTLILLIRSATDKERATHPRHSPWNLHHRTGACGDYFRFAAPPVQWASEQQLLGDVSFQRLASE